MITYYMVDTKTSTSTLGLLPNKTDNDLLNCLCYDEGMLLPPTMKFRLKKGKRPADIISYFDKVKILFFSQRFIDFLSKYANMSHKCYPITVENCDEKYYGLYNMRSFYHFNRMEYQQHCEPMLFCDEGVNIPDVFTIRGIPLLVVSDKLKIESCVEHFTNLDIDKRVYSYSEIEIEGWKKNWGKSE